jgi:hypothetical protein
VPTNTGFTVGALGVGSNFTVLQSLESDTDRAPAVPNSRMKKPLETNERRNLREQVEALLPTWQSWYPSLFDAAEDLGLIRARVCAPSMLMLSNRHASVQSEALQAFKEQWCVEDEPQLMTAIPHSVQRHLSNSAKSMQCGQPKRRR